MDDRLVGWARAVKSRRGGRLPPLWLFTDPARMPDVVATVKQLPRGLCGVVFRHDGVPNRGGLAQALLRICRSRRLMLVVAGSDIHVSGAGQHLRGGRGVLRPGLRTASVHGVAEMRRAERNGAALVFLSPAFPTTSHPGAAALGMPRWALIARQSRTAVLALGGINGETIRRLPHWVAGAGAIGAFVTAD